MNYEIGQEVEVIEDITLTSPISDDEIVVKKGDRGFIDSGGCIHYTTGDGRGKIAKAIDRTDLRGYDTANISRMILDKLLGYYDLKEFMDDYEISREEMRETIEDALTDVFFTQF